MPTGANKTPNPTDNKSMSFWKLFRYATSSDFLLIFVALISCLIKALVFAFGIIVHSELVAMFVDRNLGFGTSSKTISLPLFGGGKVLTNATREENMAELRNDSWAFGIIFTILAIVMFLTGVIYVDILNIVGLRITSKMRQAFFEATLRKHIGWHDCASNQNFAVRITDNLEKIRDGISEKLGHFVNLSMSVSLFITTSFIYGWKLNLVTSAYIPLILAANYIVAKYQSKLTIREQDSYVVAASLAEEIIGAVRTVVSFGGEKVESERFDKLLLPAHKANKLKGVFTGIGDAVTKSMQFFSVASAYYYGVILVLGDRGKTDPEYTPAVLMIAFLGILIGVDKIARCSPFLDAISSAIGSAVPIYEVIDSSTNIDPISPEGKIHDYELMGDIEFQDVFFKYPSREDVIVLRGLNLKVRAGQTVALVGHSGCGKSTCIQLLQRFYDPVFGNVFLDQMDIRELNVSWLRSNIAVVGQEPVLFQGTIGENIRHGKPNATQAEVEHASIAAGAHDFIVELPFSYDTSIGEKGVQLSGGQKQRIAIARALIQNPKILLLDEATSALDYQSEKLVQDALNAASKGRTTIVVSHRLSAIRDADKIVFIHNGKAVEEGSHLDLMKLRGKYFDMITAQEYNDEIMNEEDILDKEKYFDVAINQTSKNGKCLKKQQSKNSFSKILSTFEKDNLQGETQFWKTFRRLLSIARSEWCYLAFGTLCAMLYGCIQPAYAYLFGEFYAALGQSNPDVVLHRTSELALICVGVGFAVAAVCFLQAYIFNLAGIGLTTKLRSLTFKAILAQEIGWFDEEENSVGVLSARLSGDAASVQGSIGQPMSGMIQAAANFVCCLSFAFYFSWQMSLACLCTAPFMIGSIFFEAIYMASSAVHEKRTLEETSRIATEAIANIRTVAGLRREPQLIEEYNRDVDTYIRLLKKRFRFRGIVNSSGFSIMYVGYAIAMTYGGILCSEGKAEYYDIIKVSESLLFGLFILAISLALAPSFTTALISGDTLLRILDRKPKIKSSRHCDVRENLKIKQSLKGVRYNNVSFRYPTRPDVQVLNGLNLEVLQGKTVALVGASGCGKSTCIQLLLRYYEADRGQICIDGQDIEQDLALSTLRRRLGIVSQEPVLFEKTIAENIAYGDNYREVPMDEIIEAAKLANAHSFIVALPNGFETKLGAKGTQLSGGQKQRIAIARALVRNPQILLLDEATSALDLQSERVVQSALDTACNGRTCIVVAHRLTTIHNADLICVFLNGKITEQGNHQQLLSRDGIYAKLYKSQPVVS